MEALFKPPYRDQSFVLEHGSKVEVVSQHFDDVFDYSTIRFTIETTVPTPWLEFKE